ncbi:MAG: MMPL family transporter [Planctomycetota bacterium]
MVRASWLLLCWLIAAAGLSGYARGWTTDNRLDKWVGQIADEPGYRLLHDEFGGDEAVYVRFEGGAQAGDAPDREALFGTVHDRLGGLAAVGQVVDSAALPGPVRESIFGSLEPGSRDFILLIRPGAGPPQRRALVDELERLGQQAEKAGAKVRSAGHPLVAAALDEEAAKVERYFAPMLVLLASLAAALFLRSFTLALYTVLPAIVGSSGARTVLSMFGVDSDLILVAVGPITFVLLLASTLHLVSAFKRQRERGVAPADAARLAKQEKLPAGLLAALTTAAGFGVFTVSGIRSVAMLGAAVAGTVLVAVPLAFWAIPPLLAYLPGRPPVSRAFHRHPWRRLAAASFRRRGMLAAATAIVLVAGAFAGTRLEPETNVLHYFPDGHRVRDHFLGLEGDGVPLSTVDVFARRRDNTDWASSDFHDRLDRRLVGTPGILGAFGPEAVVDSVPGGGSPQSSRLLAAAWNTSGRVRGKWARWTTRFLTTGSEPMADLVSRVRDEAERWAASHDADVEVAGSMPLMLKMQNRLIGTMLSSLGLTTIVTTLLFLLVTRAPHALLAALLVNLAPVSFVLLFAALFRFPLDGATVMVAAVVLGLAVDNTFHLMHAARGSGMRSVLQAFDRVGRAAAVSSGALALGFASLAISGFAPTARFGMLCALGAAFALVSDLVLLPALWVRRDQG